MPMVAGLVSNITRFCRVEAEPGAPDVVINWAAGGKK
jgi:hypothetical protein